MPNRRPLEAFERPEAIGLVPVPASDGIAVASTTGLVHYLDVKSGGEIQASVPTGAMGWKRDVEGDFAGARIAAQLRGIPIAIRHDDILAAVGEQLLRYTWDGEMSVVCDDHLLNGTTVLGAAAGGEPILAGTRTGVLCSITAGKITVAPDPLNEAVLVMAIAPNRAWCLSAGEGPYWHVRDLATLSLTANAGNHIGEQFIHAMAVSKDSKHVAVTHGYTARRIKTFSVTEQGLFGEFEAFLKGNGICTTLAYDTSMRLLVAGDETGAVRVFASGVGDRTPLPRSTNIEDDPGGLIASTGDLGPGLGSWRSDREPIRGVCFADSDRLVISVNRGGLVIARAWPSGDVKWTKKVPLLSTGEISFPKAFNFGRVRPGASRTVTIEKQGTPNLEIRSFDVTPKTSFTATLKETTEGQTYQLVISVGGEATPGYVRGLATLKTNCASQPELSIYFYALVQ
jgi:hypothetical protein